MFCSLSPNESLNKRLQEFIPPPLFAKDNSVGFRGSYLCPVVIKHACCLYKTIPAVSIFFYHGHEFFFKKMLLLSFFLFVLRPIVFLFECLIATDIKDIKCFVKLSSQSIYCRSTDMMKLLSRTFLHYFCSCFLCLFK